MEKPKHLGNTIKEIAIKYRGGEISAGECSQAWGTCFKGMSEREVDDIASFFISEWVGRDNEWNKIRISNKSFVSAVLISAMLFSIMIGIIEIVNKGHPSFATAFIFMMSLIAYEYVNKELIKVFVYRLLARNKTE